MTVGNAITETPFILRASDGFPLAAQRFEPDGSENIIVAVVITCATGLHAKFEKNLQAHGIGTVTFDYRYVGLSFPPPLNPSTFMEHELHQALLSCPTDVEITTTWARVDFRAAIVHASERWTDVPLTLLGHSLGGLIVTLVPDEWHRVTRFMNACGGDGFWKYYPDPKRMHSTLVNSLIKPLETDRVFRSRNMALGQDLPHGLGKEYCEWILDPRYAFRRPHDREIAQRCSKPYIFFGFADDDFTVKKAMLKHMDQLSHADGLKQSLWIDPSKLYRWPKCGHATSFTKSPPCPTSDGAPRRREDTIWPVYLEWILHGTVDSSLGEHKMWTPVDEARASRRSKL